MAWEKLILSRRNSTVPLILSVMWIGMVIAGARLTNFDEPYLPFAIAGGLAFFWRVSPSRWEIYGWLLSSALLVKVIHLPHVPFWILRVAASLALLGFGAILMLGLRALWSEREGRENALALLAPALILVVFISGCARVLSLSSGLSSQTDDAWLYAFDGSLGVEPSFFVGRIMYDSIALTGSALLAYLSLPFVMAVVCAWNISAGARRICWHTLTAVLLAGVGGWLLYNIVPGTGPIYAFGQDFPWKNIPYKDLSTFALQKMSIPTTIPRNAMPSLHVGWVVLLWWNSKRFPGVLRAAVLIFLLLTVIATLGSGQHYLVDLVVSLPFALAVQSAASLVLPGEFRPRQSRCMTALVAGLGLTLTWLVLVRFGVSFALKSPAIPWTLILMTVSLTLWLENWMSNSSRAAASVESVARRSSESGPRSQVPRIAPI